MPIVASEVERLAAALGRTIEIDLAGNGGEHVMQQCPMCDARLGVLIEDWSATIASVRRSLFAIYDEHRCVIATDAFTQFERAERALVTAAERIALIADPLLRVRAEREADLMAARAGELRAKIR